jgi:hypothetical protein
MEKETIDRTLQCRTVQYGDIPISLEYHIILCLTNPLPYHHVLNVYIYNIDKGIDKEVQE